jgi:hypothetical protein
MSPLRAIGGLRCPQPRDTQQPRLRLRVGKCATHGTTSVGHTRRPALRPSLPSARPMSGGRTGLIPHPALQRSRHIHSTLIHRSGPMHRPALRHKMNPSTPRATRHLAMHSSVGVMTQTPPMRTLTHQRHAQRLRPWCAALGRPALQRPSKMLPTTLGVTTDAIVSPAP